MTERTRQLRLQVDDEDADPEELADLTARLRDELLDLDVEAVERPRGESPPPGTRAVELWRSVRCSRRLPGRSCSRGSWPRFDPGLAGVVSAPSSSRWTVTCWS
jgi:hypothetical protein